MHRHIRLAGLPIALFLAATALSSAVQKRAITETDLLKFVWIADPQIAPDGSRVAFVRVDVNEKADTYETSVWITGTGDTPEPRRLTAGPRDSAPRWSPDGQHVAFVRAPEEDGKVQPPQIHVMAMAGGEGRAITKMPRGAANPVWSPDGRTIAFSSITRAEDMKPKPASGAGSEKPRESDVRVISRPVYRANGVAGFGYVDPERPPQIWTIDVPAPGSAPGSPRQITNGEFASNNAEWSSDGNRIFFVSDRRPEPFHLPNDSDLYSVARTGGDPARLVSIDGSIGSYAMSPDGRRVAFIGSQSGPPDRSYSQPDLWIADLDGKGVPRNLTADYDFDVGGGLAGDQRAPRGAHPAVPVWHPDGRTITIRAGIHGNADLVRVDTSSGRVSDPRERRLHEVMSYTADRNAAAFALVVSTPTAVGDLFLSDGRGLRRLTAFNAPLFDQLTMQEPEEIWYQSFDGRRIQGWILKPPSFDASKKYPLIVQIHGGPHAAYGNTFTHEFQWMAAKGYVVLYTNPRGSSNYGQEFGNIIQYAYPGDDYKDIMAGVDEVLKKGYVDEARMGVTGGSGGGLLTNWTVTQTNRFKAAVSQRDISDWTNFWYTADFILFRKTWFRAAPFEDPEDFARRSPITHVAKIQTPMMFILGDEDWRTPPAAGGEELFRALKYLKREAVMVRFPNENHDLSRSGKPWHRVERLQHIVGWFDRFLRPGAQRSTDDGRF